MVKKTTILFLFLVLFTWTVSAERNDCCSNKSVIIEDNNYYCSDGKKAWAKICPLSQYVLQEREYSLTQDDTITDHFDEIIEKDRYCLGSIEDETELIALICLKITEASTESDILSHEIAEQICGVISIACLFLTIIVYILLPRLRDLQGKCIMITILNLLFAYIILFMMEKYDYITNNYIPCFTAGASLYFTFLSAFFWINIVAINIWRSTIRPQFLSNNKYILTFFNVYGWGGPLIFLTFALISQHFPGNHIKPDWTKHYCWFTELPKLLYYHIPILFLMLINIAIFITVEGRIWKHEENNSTNEQSTNIRKHKSRKYKCKLYLKLFLIMGIAWIFDLIWILYELNYEGILLNNVEFLFWIIPRFIFALQGIIIFLVLIAFRKRVRRDLARRGGILCGILPKRWALIPDEEMEELEDDIDEEDEINEFNVQLNPL